QAGGEAGGVRVAVFAASPGASSRVWRGLLRCCDTSAPPRGSSTLATSAAMRALAFLPASHGAQPCAHRQETSALHAHLARFASARTGYRLLSHAKRWRNDTRASQGLDWFRRARWRGREIVRGRGG